MTTPIGQEAAACVRPEAPGEAAPDLTACDREPVHLAGAIQPHGVLLVLDEPGLALVQASANAPELLGLAGQPESGVALDSLVGPALAAALRERLAATDTTGVLAHLRTVPALPGCAAPVHVFASRGQGLLILELERADGALPAGEALLGLHGTVQHLQQAPSLAAFLAVLTERVRTLTGFERVMAYRFAADGSGEVIAESLADGLEPYLGLHYPASDIPEPARRLFALSPLRHLPDVDYTPVPLLPAAPAATGGQPVDLSYASLRSISPIHLAYLCNMGARATLTLPLLRAGRLWGLIACMHHSGPLYLSYERRVPVEFLGQMAALLVMQREDLDQEAYRGRLAVVQGVLAERLGRGGSLREALLGGEVNLLSGISTDGVILIAEGGLHLLGRTPEPSAVAGLADWLAEQEAPLFDTDCLSAHYPPAADFAAASGLLTIRLSAAERVLWFRAERLAEVAWAGDPHKPVLPAADGEEGRLHPRASFALWKEEVHGHARPWLECEREHAGRLRAPILDAIAARALALERMNAELLRSNRELDAFAFAASHDLREPLRGIHNFVELLGVQEGPRLSAAGSRRLETIRRLAGRMDGLLESLLQYSRAFREDLELRPCPVGSVAAETVDFLRPLLGAREVLILIAPDLPVVPCDWARMALIFRNLISNAVKYNDQPVKRVEIGWRGGTEPPVLFVRDNGIGIPSDQQERIFALFRRLHGRDEYGGGSGAGLTIVAGAVRRHGGRIWVESAPGEGSTFCFTLAPEARLAGALGIPGVWAGPNAQPD
jgi:two-component system, chemotaxis family, sensor kinase Cph1